MLKTLNTVDMSFTLRTIFRLRMKEEIILSLIGVFSPVNNSMLVILLLHMYQVT